MSNENKTHQLIGGTLIAGSAVCAAVDMGLSYFIISAASGAAGFVLHDGAMSGEISEAEAKKFAQSASDKSKLKMASMLCTGACVMNPLIGIPGTLGAIAIHMKLDANREKEMDELFIKLCKEYQLEKTEAIPNYEEELANIPEGVPDVPNLEQPKEA